MGRRAAEIGQMTSVAAHSEYGDSEVDRSDRFKDDFLFKREYETAHRRRRRFGAAWRVGTMESAGTISVSGSHAVLGTSGNRVRSLSLVSEIRCERRAGRNRRRANASSDFCALILASI